MFIPDSGVSVSTSKKQFLIINLMFIHWWRTQRERKSHKILDNFAQGFGRVFGKGLFSLPCERPQVQKTNLFSPSYVTLSSIDMAAPNYYSTFILKLL